MGRLSLSKRVLRAPASPIRHLHHVAQAARRRGVKVFDVNIGQPDILTPQPFFQRVRREALGVLAYAPSEGYPEVIRAWQTYYRKQGIRLREQDIIGTVGGSEAILFSLTAVANPGDEVIVFEPLYPNYVTLALQAGVRLRPVVLSAANGFHLPAEREIERAVSKRTKAIIVCNPSNPTGTVLSRQELLRIVRIAKRHHLAVIADETYRDFVFTRERFVSLMEFPAIRQQVILVDSASKRFSACGARVGCLVSIDPAVIESVRRLAQARLSAPTIEQLATVPLLTQAQKFVAPARREYRGRRDLLIAELSRIPGVQLYSPEGAFYVMVTLPVADTQRFARWLLEKFHYRGESVMLAPGAGFYATPGRGKNQVRIAYVLSRPKLKRVAAILSQALPVYRRTNR